jgi:hypothetical protein
MNTSPEHDPNGNNDWSPQTGASATLAKLGSRSTYIPLAAVLLVIVGLGLLALSLNGRGDHPLYPLLPTFTPLPATIEAEPEIIGFAELNGDPAAFRGKRIQVAGIFTPLTPPECLIYTGPAIRWSLVADELQLNAIGFENILRLLEPGTEMTVIGIWSAYQGPLGCGKEPTEGTVWYLAVDRILEPNPLLGASAPVLTVIAGDALPTLSPLETVETGTTEATPTPESTMILTATATLDVALTIAITPTPELTSLPVTPLLTPGATPGLPGTPPIGATPGGSPTFGPSPTPEATSGAGGTTTPTFPTNTPSVPGYPSQPSPTATTEGGYP